MNTRVKAFLKHLYKLKKTELERKKNTEQISSRVQKVKETVLNKKLSKRTIEQEFNILEGELVRSLEKEREIIDNQNRNNVVLNDLRKQVNEVNKKLSQEKKNTEIYDNILRYLQLIHESMKIKSEKEKSFKEKEAEINKKIAKKSKVKKKRKKR